MIPAFHILTSITGKTELVFDDKIINMDGLSKHFVQSDVYAKFVGQPLYNSTIKSLEMQTSMFLHKLVYERLLIEQSLGVWEFQRMEPNDILKELLKEGM